MTYHRHIAIVTVLCNSNIQTHISVLAVLRGICELTRETEVLHWSAVSLSSMRPQLTATCQCNAARVTYVGFPLMNMLNVAAQSVN